MTNQLPNGWTTTAISDLALIVRGVTYKKTESSDIETKGFLPVMRANNIQLGKLIFDELVYVPERNISSAQKIKAGDIVVAMSSGSKNIVGKAAHTTINWEGGFGAFCGVLRPSKFIADGFLYFFTQSLEYRDQVSELSAGVNINNLKPSHFDEINLPLPPLAEQKEIATLLDNLLAQVDTLKTRLDAIPNILKRFRQSVLAAAVSGKLTEEWREENSTAKKWKKTILQNITDFQNGYAFKSDWFKTCGNYQVIKLANVKDASLKLDASPSFLSLEIAKNHLNFSPNKGDILISMTGTRHKEDYGFVCIVANQKNILINQRVGRFIPKTELIYNKFLLVYLRSEEFRKQFFKGETGGVNQGNVGSKHIQNCICPLPDFNEQELCTRQFFSPGHTSLIQTPDSSA